MAQPVIDRLELVEVDQEQTGDQTGAPGLAQGQIELSLQQGAVGELGQDRAAAR